MIIKKNLIYDGSKFKEYLTKHNMTYQDAAEKLNIDKNTIGKAVRGGNLNTSILLKICNEFGLNLSDFFTISCSEGIVSGNTQKYKEDMNINSVLEDDVKYSTTQKPILLMKDLLLSKDEEIKYLKMLIQLYDERIELLQGKWIDNLNINLNKLNK